MPGIDGTFLAVGDRLDAARVDAVAHEIGLGRHGAAVAKRQVVLVRAALVTVARDLNAHTRVGPQQRDLLIEHLGIPGPDVRLIEVEVDHRGEGRHRLFGAPPEGGEGIGPAPLGEALRLLTRPPLRIGPGDGILARPLGQGDRVRVGLGRGLGHGRGVMTGQRHRRANRGKGNP